MPRNYNKLIGKIVEVFGTRAVFAQQIWFNDGSKVFYATDMGNLNGITAPYYDLYLVEANYRDEEIQAKIAEKKVNGEYIYEKRVLRDHMSEQDAIDWVYGNMRPDSTYVWLHCHKEESK